MQGADKGNQAKSHQTKIDEDSINFRPSPNFKHMKKYLKSKFEEEEAMMIKARSSRGEQNTSSFGHNKQEKVHTSVASTPAQPPLPPNSPPPDSPPMKMNVRKEIVDNAYRFRATETPPNKSHELKSVRIKTEQSDERNVLMCRNFVRGTCNRGAACIYAHELILSQLQGVYTFCRNYQNSVCSFPTCKFVHATVFEKEYFFRTGYLPSHTLAHLNEATVLQPPLPPWKPEEKPAKLPPVFSNAPLSPTIPCIPYSHGRGRNDVFRTPHSDTNTSLPKREWSKTQEASGSTRDLDSGETLAKKCKSCKKFKFREQLIKTKVEEFTRFNEKRKQEISQLQEKNARLSIVYEALFEKSLSIPPSSASKGRSITGGKYANMPSNQKLSIVTRMLMSVNSVAQLNTKKKDTS